MRYKVRDNDTLVIEGWMLDLDFDNYAELVIFAIVYSNTKFFGDCYYRRDWFAEWLKVNVGEVENVIEILCDKGYISKRWQQKGKQQEQVLVTGLALGGGNE